MALTLLPPSVREYCVPPAAGPLCVVFFVEVLEGTFIGSCDPRSTTILSIVFRAIFCYRKKLQHYIVRSTPSMVDPNPAMLFKEPCAGLYFTDPSPYATAQCCVVEKGRRVLMRHNFSPTSTQRCYVERGGFMVVRSHCLLV